ncbi:MAG: hypothetical protein LUG91_09175 [Ruminococcus sp.]|nr:hypothetical protein [Ruminococcus sp.]
MTCNFYKSALNAVNTTSQTVAADGFVDFNSNSLLTGCAIQHIAGSNSIVLVKPGLYSVSFNADIVPAAAGDITLQLVANGVNVAGAEATVTGATTDTANVSFNSVVRVRPNCPVIDNTTTLQVEVNAAGTISNANISVIKLA